MGALGSVDQERREACERLSREPAIARIVTTSEDGERYVFYISSVAPQDASLGGARLASYKSPAGRLAVLPLGDGIELGTPNGVQFLEVVEAAALDPRRIEDGWDGIETKVRNASTAPRSLTIDSLRRFLAGETFDADSDDAVERLLAEEAMDDAIRVARQRRTIEKASLRDTRLLDLYQDAIFRLPIDSRLAIMGPPGTGKTTTLIVRLGQKIRPEYLDAREQALLDAQGVSTNHALSWLMFTPTDLLKQYVRSAFGRHQIPAPDDRIVTWDNERLRLARNVFGLLRAGSGSGFIMPPDAPTLLPATLADQIAWHDDFDAWQANTFWTELAGAAARLAANADPGISSLGSRLAAAIERAPGTPLASVLLAIAGFEEETRALVDRLRTESDQRIRRALNLQVNSDRGFLDALAAVLDGLSDAAELAAGTDDDDDVDADEEDDDEPTAPRIGRAAAIAAFGRTLRTQARARARGRRTLRGRTARITEWLGDRGLPDDALLELGRSLIVQADTRRMISPARAYFQRIGRRYRQFRRERRAENRWYSGATQVVHTAEVDLMLLAILRPARALLADARIAPVTGSAPFSWLATVASEFRNQVMVDEATDFSPLQLGCMAALANPAFDSIFLCGDFNQRLTIWGSRTEHDLLWALPAVEIQNVAISYRQSRQLHDLSVALLEATGSPFAPTSLPPDIDNEGVDPVLGMNLDSDGALAEWLDQRLIEIEGHSGGRGLPSIAVLVNDEARVRPLAERLDARLMLRNLRATACIEGRMIGEQSEVRVFDVQHIKGLEFEAVFFVDVDELQRVRPELFERYLYVGTTRAATYLGITCAAGELPASVQALESRFIRDWT
ncbi:ATP-binding domain-containing protein [Sphingobium aromaticiconvertens]|uniref:ATP-binding domain-containing protein n=1 Tax=Sphingobium aromaticiconvertens TaxID=365341 RepID=UPI00301B2B6C